MTDFVATSMNQDSYVSVQGESTPLSRLATSSYRAPMDEGCGEYTKEANQYLANYYEDRELIKADKSETLKLSVFKRIKEKWVSIKIVNREKLSFESEMFFIQEINVLKDLFHPNIIQLIDCVIYPNSYSVVYEHFSGEDLQQKIANRKSYNELVARNWIQGIFDAVKFCHQRNIVHRNICPENIIFANPNDESSIKLVDFGCAIEARGHCINELVGLSAYLAPEMVEGRPYGKEVDMWALGVTLHFLLGGIHPFSHDDEEVMNRKITRAQFDFTSPYWFNISGAAKELVRHLLLRSPTERYTAEKAVVSRWMLASLAETSRQVNVDLFSIHNIPHDDISEEFLMKYHIYNILGKGAYGIVKKGISKVTKDEVAIKMYDLRKMSTRAKDSIVREVQILQEFNHPNIVRAIDSYRDVNRFYFVMQLVVGGELLERISKRVRYTEKEARGLVRKLLETIKYIHDHNIVHRDLKPQNLLLTSEAHDAEVVVVDFGFAKKIEAPDSLRTYCGTLDFMAPEIIARKGAYGKGVDIWSFGVILYILLGGYPPFSGSKSNLPYLILEGRVEFDPAYWSHVSDPAKNLIQALLEVNPSKRLTADQALEHPWLQAQDEELDKHQLSMTELRKHLIHRKLRALLRAVLMTQRLRRLSFLTRRSSSTRQFPGLECESQDIPMVSDPSDQEDSP